jgi:hypothetical protein
MRRVLTVSVGMCASILWHSALALANEPKADTPDYSGISYLYYTVIGVVLAYGVYDTFFKKS